MDGSGHAAAGKELRIGRVDDRVESRLSGDVAAHTLDDDPFDSSFHGDPHPYRADFPPVDCLFAVRPAMLRRSDLWPNHIEHSFER